MPAQSYVVPLTSIDPDYHPELGARVITLATLAKLGVPTPPVGIITPLAVLTFLKENNLLTKIESALRNTNPADPYSLDTQAKAIARLIQSNPYPKELEKALQDVYQKDCHDSWVTLNFSWSSVFLPDIPVHTTPIKGDSAVLHDIRFLVSQLLTAANLHHLLSNPTHSFLTHPPALVMRQFFPAERSGIVYTSLPDQKNHVRIEALWGQHPTSNQEALVPDTYIVSRTTKAVVHQEVMAQHRQFTIDRFGKVEEKSVAAVKVNEPKLAPLELKKIIELSDKIHHHAVSPQKIWWVIAENTIYVTKNQYFDATEVKPAVAANSNSSLTNLKHLARGVPASPGIISGPAKVVHNPKEITKLKTGEILVAPFASIQLLPAFKKAAGIVAEEGGPTSHAAIAARETGIPAVVHAQNCTKLIKNGQTITINGSTGDIFLGGHTRSNQSLSPIGNTIPQKLNTEDSTSAKSDSRRTATKLFVNLSGTKKALELGPSSIDGVGRIRGELLLAEYGMHPQKIMADKKVANYQEYLTNSLLKVSQAFGDRPVYYQLSDLPTNQRALLAGGDRYEPREVNPFLGLHGTTRLLANPEWVEVELKAIKTARHTYACHNLHLLTPLTRSKKELLDIKRVISAMGLSRGAFQVHCLLQTPANLTSVDAFAEVGIDGIGLDMVYLQALMTGVDPENQEVSHLQDFHTPGLWQLIRLALQSAHSHQIKTIAYTDGINKYEELLAMLVEFGIGTVSVEPHQLQYTREALAKAEAKKIL